jgi:hypothetical protein
VGENGVYTDFYYIGYNLFEKIGVGGPIEFQRALQSGLDFAHR